jgi:predicted metal-dependent peptidase
MANKGTNVETAPVSEATEQEAKDFQLDPYLLDLLWNEPFYSAVMRKLTKIRTESLPTAGVCGEKGELKLFWNPKFVASLSAKEVRGLLKHECWHIVLGHIFDRRKDPHLQWNYATDWAINCNIPEEELPECGLRAGRPYPELTPEQLDQMSDQRIQDYNTLSQFQASLPLYKSAEWYFSELMNNAEAQEALNNQQDSEDRGSGEGQPGEGGGNPMPGEMDNHDGWDNLSDEDREFLKGKVKHIVEEASKEADGKSRGWGSVGAEGRQAIREIISKEIPWQSVLKNFCGLTRRANRTSNVRRLNRKYPGIHPGHNRGYTSSIAVYVDQSGSVGDKDLELLFGELRSLARQTEFTIFNFDTQVDETSERVWKRGKTPDGNRTRHGGTCFNVVTKHANKNSNRFDGYLILTDGEASDPGPSRLKRGWVIIPDNKLYFQASKRDFVIKMKNSN